MTRIPHLCIIGVGGYGRVHLRHLLEFHARREIRLAAAVVFPPESDAATCGELDRIGCAVYPDFASLMAALPGLQIDLAIVPTPIHLHARMSIALLRQGVNVLVEKPITASSAEAADIARVARETGRLVAVGFQYLHAPEVLALKSLLSAGAIGPLRRLVVHAAWPRSHSYYTRNNWAGRLRIGDDPVLDSPVNNAMSHFLMLMLFLAERGAGRAAQPVRLAAELYRAQEIESFDTGVVRFETADGCRLDFYGTHSSREIDRPSLLIEGATGSAEWEQDGFSRLSGPSGHWEQLAGTEATTREQMLRDVLARLRGEDRFICTPELASAHVRCVSALHDIVPITPVPETARARRELENDLYTFVPGLDEALVKAARLGTGLAEAGVSWAVDRTRAEF